MIFCLTVAATTIAARSVKVRITFETFYEDLLINLFWECKQHIPVHYKQIQYKELSKNEFHNGVIHKTLGAKPPNDESMSNQDLNLNLFRMQDDEIVQVIFLCYEIKAKYITQLADISITLATSCEERLTDLVREYLQHLP